VPTKEKKVNFAINFIFLYNFIYDGGNSTKPIDYKDKPSILEGKKEGRKEKKGRKKGGPNLNAGEKIYSRAT